MSERRRMLIVGQSGRTKILSGITSTNNTWELFSDGEFVVINPTSAARSIGSITGWDNTYSEIVTSVRIEGNITNVDNAGSTFATFVNNEKITTSIYFGRGISTNQGLRLKYIEWRYEGTLADWCINREMYRTNATYFPENAYDLYCDEQLVAGDIITSTLGISGAFARVDNIISVELQTLKSIPQYSFQGCTSLTSVTMPNSVTSIGQYSFQGCTSLTSVTMPNSVTSIGVGSFRDCTSLTSVTIPSSVSSIGTNSFYGCTSLTSVTIPNSVSSIGVGSFENCRSIEVVDCTATTAVPSCHYTSFRSAFSANGKILVPNELYDEYITKWSSFASRIVAV